MERVLMNRGIKLFVEQVFPGYKGRTVYADVRETATYYGTMWSGGSGRDYAVVNLATRRIERIPQESFGALDPFYREGHAIAPGHLVVCHQQGASKYVLMMGSVGDLATVGVALPVSV